MTDHAHVLDPSWDLTPIPWALGVDATTIPRIHAAVMDDCRACLDDIGAAAALDSETMAVVIAMALSIAKSIPPQLLPNLKGVVPFEPPMMLMLDRAIAAGDRLNSREVLAIARDMEPEDRCSVFRGCVGMMELYVTIKGADEEPVR